MNADNDAGKAGKLAKLKILVAVARADGRIDDAERRLLESVCAGAGLSRADLDSILEERSAISKADLPTSPKERRDLLADVLRLAAADGHIDKSEIGVAKKIAKALGLSGRDVEECIRDAQLPQRERRESLGTPASAEDATIPTSKAEPSVQAPRAEQEDAVPVEWKVGDLILDTYEVKQLDEANGVDFAEGGFGRVYRVHHKGWNLELAVKSPLAKVFVSETQKSNFEHECETWINLGLHPHVVSCHYVRRLGGIPRVFAEYMEGGSLSDWIGHEEDEVRKLYEGGHDEALKRIFDIAIQFAWGLQYSHDQKLIHQDVKPGNVMMSADGTAKVTDFGLARARASSNESANEDAARSLLATCGGMTPAYASPEQVNKQELTRGTDIWSWAVSMLEMFTGEVTWQAGQVAHEAFSGYVDMGASDERIPKMPEVLQTLLTQCLQPDPNKRPADFREIVEQLKTIFQDTSHLQYERPSPDAVDLLAAQLNNKALTLLDLNKPDQAQAAWHKALEVEPHHPEATYNHGLHSWRCGDRSDTDVVNLLEEMRKSHTETWIDEYFLALIHLERDDPQAAIDTLSQASKSGFGQSQLHSLLELAQKNLLLSSTRSQDDLPLTPACISVSDDGRYALSAGGLCGQHDLAAVVSSVFSGPQHLELLKLWDLESSACIRSIAGCYAPDHSQPICLNADGRLAVVGGKTNDAPDGEDLPLLQLWDVAEGEVRTSFEGHEAPVLSVGLSSDGRTVASASRDGVVKIWDAASGACRTSFQCDSGSRVVISLSRDARIILCAPRGARPPECRGYPLWLWDVATGDRLCAMPGHSDCVTSVSLCAEARYALSGSYDGTVKFWDATSGRALRTMRGHDGHVQTVSLSADGRYGLSGGDDRTVRLWDTFTGRCLRTISAHAGQITSVRLFANGSRAISASSDRSLKIWTLHRDFRAPFAVCRPCSSAGSPGTRVTNGGTRPTALQKELTKMTGGIQASDRQAGNSRKVDSSADRQKARVRLKTLIAVAMADGRLDSKERAFLESMAKDAGVRREDLDLLLSQKLTVDRSLLPTSAAEKRRLITDLIRMARADGKIDEAEQRVIGRLAKSLGLGADVVGRCARDAARTKTAQPIKQKSQSDAKPQKESLARNPLIPEPSKPDKKPGFWAKMFAPEYFEVPVPDGDGLCSDDACPCPEPGTSIPRGSGYLYISPDAVAFRKDCVSISEFRAKMERIQSGEVFFSFHGSKEMIAPILICEQGARKRLLDLEAAAADARHWWDTGKVPLRPTRKR